MSDPSGDGIGTFHQKISPHVHEYRFHLSHSLPASEAVIDYRKQNKVALKAKFAPLSQGYLNPSNFALSASLSGKYSQCGALLALLEADFLALSDAI